MTKATENLNDQFKQFADFQTRSMEPMRQFAEIATEATEQLMRKNYAVMGDWVEFAVKQAQLPLEIDNPGDLMGAQLAESKKMTETLSNRAVEYVELSKGLGEKVKTATGKAAAAVKAA